MTVATPLVDGIPDPPAEPSGRAEVEVVARDDGSPAYPHLYSTGSVAARVARDGLYLVGAAAGPIGGDLVEVDLRVGPAACLVVRSSSAPVARRGRVDPHSVVRVTVGVEPGATIVWLTEPAVVAAGASHEIAAEVELACGSTLAWYDAVRLGRAGEPPGSWRSRLSVRSPGTPGTPGTPRSVSDLRLGSLFPEWQSQAVLSEARCLQSLVLIDPRSPPLEAGTERLRSAWGGSLPLARGGVQLIAFGDDFSDCGDLLGRLLDRAGGGRIPGVSGLTNCQALRDRPGPTPMDPTRAEPTKEKELDPS